MKPRWLLCLVLAALFVTGCVSGRSAGRADARRDLSNGILGLEAFGRHATYIVDEYYPLLKSRYGITVRDYGCLVDERTIQHTIGYNEIMDVEMARLFGTNFWREAMADAREVYESKQK